MKTKYLGINIFDALRFGLSKSPLFLAFSPTSRCNSFCKHCFNWRNVKNSKTRQELSLEEIKQIATNLGYVKYVTITGGEPFLREDLSEIINIFHTLNKTRRLVIHTNGSLPEKVYSITKKILESCPKLYVTLCVSIDSLFEKHDKIRNTKGSFKKALRTIILLKKFEKKYNRFSLRSLSCLSKLNIKDIVQLHEFMEKEIGVAHGVSLIRGDVINGRELAIGPEEYANVCQNLSKDYKTLFKNYSIFYLLKNIAELLKPELMIQTLIQRKMLYRCKAGKRAVVIMDNGDVYPCELFNKVNKLGNLRGVDYDLYRVLNSETAKNALKSIEKGNCWCTWEHMITINTIFNIRAYSLIIKKCFQKTYLQALAAYIHYNLMKQNK